MHVQGVQDYREDSCIGSQQVDPGLIRESLMSEFTYIIIFKRTGLPFSLCGSFHLHDIRPARGGMIKWLEILTALDSLVSGSCHSCGRDAPAHIQGTVFYTEIGCLLKLKSRITRRLEPFISMLSSCSQQTASVEHSVARYKYNSANTL